MKKVFAIIAVAVTMFAANANAQISFGLKGGLNLTSVSLDGALTDNLKSENQAGFFIGPSVKFTLPIVGLGVDASALYNQKQSKISETSVKQQSVAIPLNLRYSLPVLPVYVFAGPQFDFNVGDKSIDFSKDNGALNLSNYSLKDSQISVNVGAGVTLSGFQVSVNYNIACGKTGDFDASSAAGQAWDTLVGNATANSWQLGVAYYF